MSIALHLGSTSLWWADQACCQGWEAQGCSINPDLVNPGRDHCMAQDWWLL